MALRYTTSNGVSWLNLDEAQRHEEHLALVKELDELKA